MPTRAPSCSRPAGPRWMRSTASRPRWRSSSACRAAAARARWAPPPRSGTSCACCTSSWACSTASTTARAVQPQTPDSIAAQILTQLPRPAHRPAGAAGGGRKGVYTELADWARPRGFTHLRVDGEFLPTTGFPRIDRFKEHTIELPVMSLPVARQRAAAARRRWRARWSTARAWCMCSATSPACATPCWRARPRRHRPGAGVLDQARLPGVQHQLRRARPAPVLLQQQARLVPRLRRHRRAS
jgi:hypothetical protein